jgi:sigma-B regulation protein RsbQ
MPPADQALARHNVNVRGDPSKPPMVFAHGFGCDQNMWRYVAPAFEATHRVVLFDYAGCGRSASAGFDPARYRTLDGYAQDLLDVCAALDLHGAVLVGHSVSAMIGLLAAIREPARFRSMVMVAPSPRYVNDPPYVGGLERADVDGLLSLMDHNFIGWASYLAPVVMAHPERPGLAGELQDSFCSTDPVAARTFALATFLADNRADLPRAPVPSLILQVRDDAIAPVSVGEYLRDHMPRSELAILETTGHCPHMSDPQPTIDAIRAYVERPDA